MSQRERRDTRLGVIAEVYLEQLPENTRNAYGKALAQFMAFLNKPAARHLSLGPAPGAVEERSLESLGKRDVSMIVDFIDWLAAQKPEKGRHDRLSAATIRQRGVAVINWFTFMDERALLPDEFPVVRALSTARRVLRKHRTDSEKIHKAVEPPPDMARLIHYYDHVSIPDTADEARAARLRKEGLRNKALVYALADTGARISEVLGLRVEQFLYARPPADDAVLRREVRIKGGGKADLVFTDFSVHAIQDYLQERGPFLSDLVFVSHYPPTLGAPLSRSSAWRIVSTAAKRLGMDRVHPHDFRHWRATEMRRAGVPIEIVQDFLNHRSIEITRRFYAATSPEEVNVAASDTKPE